MKEEERRRGERKLRNAGPGESQIISGGDPPLAKLWSL